MRLTRRVIWAGVLWCSVASVAAAKAAPKEYNRLTQELTAALATGKQMTSQLAGYDVVFRRDPMQALVDEQGTLVTSAGLHGGMSVDGIIWSEDHPLAVIDGDLVPPGGSIGPYVVREIKQDGVVVTQGQGDPVTIPLAHGLEIPSAPPGDAPAAPEANPSPDASAPPAATPPASPDAAPPQ